MGDGDLEKDVRGKRGKPCSWVKENERKWEVWPSVVTTYYQLFCREIFKILTMSTSSSDALPKMTYMTMRVISSKYWRIQLDVICLWSLKYLKKLSMNYFKHPRSYK